MNRLKPRHGLIAGLLILGCLLTAGTAAGMDYTLFIFGNANEDQNIDRKDIELLEGIIAGKAAPTKLADANHDGKVDRADIEQVEKILNGSAAEIVVQDAYGQAVTVKTPVGRIVSLDQMIAENAQVLGLGAKVVGVDQKTADRTIIHPEISRQANVGSSDEPDIERIVSLQPGLVAGIQYFDETLIKKMESAKLRPLAMIFHGDIQNSLGYSKLLGYLAGSPASANEYIEWMSGILDGIHNKISTIPYEERTKVIYLYPRKNGALGSGGNSCPTIRALQYLGANTMTDNTRDSKGAMMDAASYFEIDPEVVIQKNPAAIVMEDFDTALGYGFKDPAAARGVLDAVKTRPGFGGLDAVKNNKVFLLDVNVVSHSNCLGAIYMAKALYPELLKDVDPYAIHQEYVDRFLKLSKFDIKKDGIFIYPPVE
ncbi:MAG: ABC transporter substrate-binding protein [Pseudomonadota bacterium]